MRRGSAVSSSQTSSQASDEQDRYNGYKRKDGRGAQVARDIVQAGHSGGAGDNGCVCEREMCDLVALRQ